MNDKLQFSPFAGCGCHKLESENFVILKIEKRETLQIEDLRSVN